MGMSFIPLHVYSGFSYLQSGLTTKKIASLAKKRGYLYCGLTDNGTLSGFAPFYHQAGKEGVKPVLGMDVQLEIGTLSLFVKNEEGYRNDIEIMFEAVLIINIAALLIKNIKNYFDKKTESVSEENDINIKKCNDYEIIINDLTKFYLPTQPEEIYDALILRDYEFELYPNYFQFTDNFKNLCLISKRVSLKLSFSVFIKFVELFL